MDYKEILKEFMCKPAASGYEKLMAYRLKQELEKTANEVFIDNVGNVISRYQGTENNAPCIMVYAHLDQLGFIVRKIEASGYIRVDRLGGIPEKVLPGLNVQIFSQSGQMINGIFGNKSHHATSSIEKYAVDPVTSLYIDVGASSKNEVHNMGINIGSPVIYKPHAQNLGHYCVSGTAVDDRGGLTALVVLANYLAERPHKSTVYIVGSVWEEFNLRGAMLAARSCTPDIAICLDVVISGDTPDLIDKYDNFLGKGPVLMLYTFHGRGTLNGTLPHPNLVRLVEKTAQEDNIPLQRFAGIGILTDSSYVQLEHKGIASIELGFPARYTHTPVEVCNINDILMLGRLVHGVIQRVDCTYNMHRY